MPVWDFIIVGAGPCGLSCAASFQAAGLSALVLEKGCLVDSIYRFPERMRFFSGPAGIEIGGLRMQCATDRPTRSDALVYYRQVTRQFHLNVRQFTPVSHIDGCNGDFLLNGERAAKVVIATGYYGWPNLLRIPGEDLPKVMHYFKDEHPYAGARVMVIGGRNSAGNVAVAMSEAGAEVTLVHRRDSFSMKPWLQEAVESADIRILHKSHALAIEPQSVHVRTPAGCLEIANDFVFAMTGYHPDSAFLRTNRIPGRDGIYMAGAVCGQDVNIENGRSHAERILMEIDE